MAWSAHETGSYDVQGIADQYPTGYPFMVRLLLGAGLGRTLWLNLLSLGWLAVGSASAFWMARRQFQLSPAAASLVVCAPLLSWVTIKHAVLPLSDIPYLGISMLSLALLQHFWLSRERLAWKSGLLALLLALAALQVRTVGLALVGAVIATMVLHPRVLGPLLSRANRRRLWLTGLLAAGTGTLALIIVVRTQWFQTQFLNSDAYFRKLTAFLGRDGDGPTLLGVIGFRLREAAEVVLNLPLRPAWTLLAVPVGLAGVACLGWASVRLWVSHRPLVLYLGLSAAVLLLWPFIDSRFLLPLLPVASLLLVSAFSGWVMAHRRHWCLTIAYLGVYALLGLAALGYSSRLTFAGAGFVRIYSSGNYQLTYRHAFGLEPDVPPDLLDRGLLATLQRYEPLAGPRARSAP